MTRDYGWSKRGDDAVIVRPHRGAHLSVIGVLRLTGVVAPMVVDGPVDGDTFCQWLRAFLPAQTPLNWWRNCGYATSST